MGNILLTSAGRRGYLVSYFKKSMLGYGKVYASNSSLLSPALKYADETTVTPLIYDRSYIPFLIDYCRNNDIEAIIPLFDPDVKMLSKHINLFKDAGITLVVSDYFLVDMFNDKWKMNNFCIKNDLLSPKTYLSEDDVVKSFTEGMAPFPIMIKPRWGMGSVGLFCANDIEELHVLGRKAKECVQQSYLKYEAEENLASCVIYQEFIQGDEYGLDIINDLNGNYCRTVVKKKWAMRSGETDCASVICDRELEQLGARISSLTHHIANMDMDIILSKGKYYILDVNMRFGGGYPFTHMSGIDLPTAIVKWLHGEPVDDELTVKEYDRIWQKDIHMLDITSI